MPDPIRRPTTPDEHLLARFVDRDAEIARFGVMLDTRERSIMIVWGESGVGKSSLQTRLIHECVARNVRKVRVAFRPTRALDYMTVMYEIRDALGESSFASFTELVESYRAKSREITLKYEGGPISVASQAKISGAHVGAVAGIIVEKVEINASRTGIEELESERMVKLTKCFVDCLQRVLAEGPVVFFLDDLEKMSPGTEDWLWGELLALLRDGALSNLAVVVCGQRKPSLETDWDVCTEIAEIGNFERSHIEEYLAKRGVPLELRPVAALTLHAVTKGKVGDLVEKVGLLLETLRSVPR
jgi:hypothetical protein